MNQKYEKAVNDPTGLTESMTHRGLEISIDHEEAIQVATRAVRGLIIRELVAAGYNFEIEEVPQEAERTYRLASIALVTAIATKHDLY